MPSIATMAHTLGALLARRARRWWRRRSRCRAPSGPLLLDGCLAFSSDAYGSVHRRDRHGSTGASLMLSTAKMARTIGTDAARWGRRPARRRPQRLAPTDPLWLNGRTIGRCDGHNGAHRRVLERHAQRRFEPSCRKKQNSRNQVLTGFEPPTPGRDPKVTPDESGCLSSH